MDVYPEKAEIGLTFSSAISLDISNEESGWNLLTAFRTVAVIEIEFSSTANIFSKR